MKKVYIAGKITGESNFKEIFKSPENEFIRQGFIVMNPAELPSGFDYEDYMKVCFANPCIVTGKQIGRAHV